MARPIWSWDIEADDWDQVRCVVAVSTDGDVERRYGRDSLERMHDEVMKKAQGNWVAHAGGIYDTLLLLEAREKPFKELVMSGSAILCAKDGALAVRDSYRWWLQPLAAVGKYLDKEAGGTGEWLKKEVDRQRIKQLTEKEVLDYCESDTRILLRGVERCRAYIESQGARPAWTSGATALNILQVLEPASWALLERYKLDFDTAKAARACIRGARVECFAQGKVEGVHCYDFKSAYPAAYAFAPVPIGAVQTNDLGRHDAIWRCRWFWPDRAGLAPVLDQKTGAGAGWCEAWCVREEIEDLERAGVRPEFLEGWAPELVAPIGQLFVRELYRQKEEGAFWAKVAVNSYHGKGSENPIRENYNSVKKPTEFYGPEPKLIGDYWHSFSSAADDDGYLPRHVQPLQAATILGRPRSAIYRADKAVIDAGYRVFYNDTDSLHTDCPPETMTEIGKRTGAFTIGTALGQLNHEGGPFVGYYLGPKAYALVDPKTGKAEKGALKGVPWKTLKDGVRERGTFGKGGLWTADDNGPAIYRQARDDENGTDLRLDLFERVIEEGHVYAQKEGLRTFVSGLKRDHKNEPAPWGKQRLIRRIRADVRNKRIGAVSQVFAYRTPREVITARSGAQLRGATREGRAFLRSLSSVALYREGAALVEAAGTVHVVKSSAADGLHDINNHLGLTGARAVKTPAQAWRRLAGAGHTGIDTVAALLARARQLDAAAAWMRTIPGWEAFSVGQSTGKMQLLAHQIEEAEEARRAAVAVDQKLTDGVFDPIDEEAAVEAEDDIDHWG